MGSADDQVPMDCDNDLTSPQAKFIEPVTEWLEKFKANTFNESDIRKHWSKEVPIIFSPKRGCDCLNISFNEETARVKLILTLEQFMTNSVEPSKVFGNLKNLDNKPMLCGKVFKNNEPTYCCRDCGLDQTCVLCVDCFKQSAHRNHKYKMHMSSGAGYCDCGDLEAWKANAFCDSHIQGYNEYQSGNHNDARERLPHDLAQRSEQVIRTVSNYCFELLDWEHTTSLPKSLRPENEADMNSEDYVTMLFNDEIHTYEQVIQTLSRAIECTQKEAIDFATTIDHEGRSIVKCSVFQTCSSVKHMIEKITSRHGSKPLRCDVMLTSIIAYQTYAMRLLAWLQKILTYCEGFRSIFSSIMMEPYETYENVSLLESVMKADVRLWKTARNQWHQIFITGLLMDPDSKKAFAKVFTRIYPSLMKDFINDDHEHSISITCLAVQIFTVPSLARVLIAEVDAFYILTETFLKKCGKHINQQGKLAFERNHATITSFRRAQFILSDIKYLLSVKPTEWNDALRKNFFHGFCTLVSLLQWMQGMDSVIRQVGQHVEFEAEWETGINLQLKLAPVLSLVIEWCGSDRIILMKTLRYVLQELCDKSEPMKVEKWIFCEIRCKCIEYDVSTSQVTVHLPFHRLISGLLLCLTFYDMNYLSPKFVIPKRPSPMELMELPLRTLVMIAQFRAGMWRRNGYSLANQVYFYHNVRLRDEMYDRDIIMLQYVASIINPNEFICHLLNKFGIIFWAQSCYENTPLKREEDYMRQTIVLVEEFLGLLLTVLSERYVPGIGKITFEEKIKREIIQWLCIEPMTHSDLLKCLPREISEDIVIENMVMEVANFKRPAPNQAGGKYELKEEYYEQFNTFFYHYTRQDHSTAEEVQIKRKKANKEKLICCPPPVPPDLTSHFAPLRQILQCDLFLHIIVLVLERTCSAHTFSFSETQFEKILHLIGLALHEEIRILKLDSPEKCDFVFSELAAKKGIQKLLENCLKCDRIGTHRDLLKWTLKKFAEVSSLRGQNATKDTSGVSLSATEDLEQASSVQKRDKKSTELAAQRRARIMAQMKDMQKSFIKGNFEYFKPLEDSKAGSSSKTNLAMMEVLKDDELNGQKSPVAVGSQQCGKHFEIESHICILCREEQELTPTGPCMVYAAFVQRSTVLSKNHERKINNSEDPIEALLMPADLYFGAHVSTCGHVMHSDCWQKFFESVLTKERRRPLRYGRHVSFDVDKNEFLCPFCECLSNAVIPLIPNCLYRTACSSNDFSEISLSDWLSAQHDAVEKVQPLWVKDPSMSMETGERYICRFKPNSLPYVLSKLNSTARDAYENNIHIFNKNAKVSLKPTFETCEMMKLLSQSIFTIDLNVHPNLEDDRVLVLSYWACAFTIHSFERVLREERKSIFGDMSSRRYHCLQALVRYVGVSSIEYNISIVRSHCIRLLRYLLIFDNYVSSPSCLDVDAFGLLVSLVLSNPSLYLNEDKGDKISALFVPNGNVFDQHYINLIIVFHIIQIILTNKAGKSLESVEADLCSEADNENELQFVYEFYTGVLVAAGVQLPESLNSKFSGKNSQKAEAAKILRLFKSQLLPFMRCTAIFFHFLTGVVPPARLKEGEGLDSPPLPEEEYHLLCKYLGLSSKFSILIGSTSFHHLARFWSQHPRIRVLLSITSPDILSPADLPLKLIIQPHSVNRLIDLPNDYSELINSVSQFTCPNSDGDDARSPTMCLVCGTILCSQSYCCQSEIDGNMVGACTYHAYNCGAGVGIFLRIRDCKIVLLAGRSKGCYMPPPYIDEYGETDQGLIRGNPLQLCDSSYKELHRLWLRHGIPEQIAHALVLSSNLATINWQLF